VIHVPRPTVVVSHVRWKPLPPVPTTSLVGTALVRVCAACQARSVVIIGHTTPAGCGTLALTAITVVEPGRRFTVRVGAAPDCFAAP
jgi:hypothetical protein